MKRRDFLSVIPSLPLMGSLESKNKAPTEHGIWLDGEKIKSMQTVTDFFAEKTYVEIRHINDIVKRLEPGKYSYTWSNEGQWGMCDLKVGEDYKINWEVLERHDK